MDDLDSLANVDVDACGSPAMIEDVRDTLIAQRNLRHDAFFADSFGDIGVKRTRCPEGVIQVSANGINHSTSTDQSPLAALRGSGVAIPSVCGGRGACGTCIVEIDDASRAMLAPPGRDEQELLQCLPNVTPRSRLACQIRLDRLADGLLLSVP
jgi:ferredoxin